MTGASSGIGRATAAALAAAGARVAGGARRVERLETEIALELDVTDAGELRAASSRRRSSVSAASTSSSTTPVSRSAAPRSTSRARRTRRRSSASTSTGLVRMTRLCLPHFGDWGHIVNMGSVAGRAGVRGRRVVRRGEVRRARLHVRAARGPPRPADPDHDGRSRPDRDGVLARPLQGRRGEGGGGLPRRRSVAAGGHRRLHPLRAHPAVARERRRDRRQGAQPVLGRADPARRMSLRVVIVTRIPPVLAGFDAVVRASRARAGRVPDDARTSTAATASARDRTSS